MAEQSSLRFISDAAHDLIGPVNQISSLVELFVHRYRGQVDDEAQTFLTHIESAGARLSATATGLSTYFNIAGFDCRLTRVHLGAVLESVLFALRRDIQESQAEIISGELPDVQGDPRLLTTLLRVLLENSLKFCRPGVPARILLSAECSAARCCVSIIDNGIGIEPRYHEEVFFAFKKLNGHVYPGGGMGLTIARAIVDVLGGKIRIAEMSGPGTAVVLELPLAL